MDAFPGKGSNVPLYILESGLFGAQLATALGLPFAFASHFAPDWLQTAVAAHREEFQPSEQLEKPYVMAGVNVMAADNSEAASHQLQAMRAAPGGLLLWQAARHSRPRRRRSDRATRDQQSATRTSRKGEHAIRHSVAIRVS